MAHALEGHDGKCRNIHGHSYKLSVTLIGQPIEDSSSPKFGMVMDFADLKTIINAEIIDKLDHGLMLYKKSEFLKIFDSIQFQQLILVPYNPTCENMVIDFAKKIKSKLPNNVALHNLRLQETKTSYAEWFSTDN